MIALYIILGIVLLVILLALVTPKNFKMERSIVISKSKAEVFEYIKSLKNQDNWSVWAKKDPNMKKEFRGTDCTVGFVSRWESEDKSVGIGEQEIKKITEGERIDFELRFEKPFKATNDTFMIIETVGNNQTKLSWGFSGKMKFPMTLFHLLMNMEKMIGKDFEEGLSNLKKIVEK
jgi:hypothetical protein